MAEWYYMLDDQKMGPISSQDLKRLADAGRLEPSDFVWKAGMEDWELASEVPGLFRQSTFAPPIRHSTYSEDAEIRRFAGNKISAGICGILLGALGVHKFILGFTTAGLIMLLVSLLTCGFGAIVTGIIGLIEGIIYLTKSDEEFYERYAIEKRSWF